MIALNTGPVRDLVGSSLSTWQVIF